MHSNEIAGPTRYVALENYHDTRSDPRYKKALLNTIKYTLLCIGVILPLALWLSHLLQHTWKPARPVFSFLLLLPSITPPMVLALLFLLVFHGRDGLLNQMFVTPFGLKAINWLKDPDWILAALVIQSVWRWTGLATFFLMSATDGIPKTYLEAARLDGAKPRQSFWHVCLPFLRPMLLFILAYLFIDAFAMFSGAYMLLGGSGGTSDAGLLLVTFTYQTAFEPFNAFGKATAISLSLVPWLVGVILLILLGNRGWRIRAEGRSA